MKTHKATSKDGTTVTGRVYGEGPPLVLLPAGPGDCETSWGYLIPYLRNKFSCYLLNTRGRGLSEDHTDHSIDRLIEDIVTFSESIGEPVGLVEWASFVGAAWSFSVSQKTKAVVGVASYESIVVDLASKEDADRVDELFITLGDLAGEGRLDEAARTFVEKWYEYGFYTDEDMAGEATSKFWNASSQNILLFLQELQEAQDSTKTDTSELANTVVPVLLLKGSKTHPLHDRSVNYVAENVKNSTVRIIEGASHFGPHTHPEAVSKELTAFFEGIMEPA